MSPRVSRAVLREFWELVGEGMAPSVAAVASGVSGSTGTRLFAEAGGVKPRLRVLGCSGKKPRLSLAEREEIAIGNARDESANSIAKRLGRATSTITREIERNTKAHRYGRRVRYRHKHRFGASARGPVQQVNYRAVFAQQRADARASRPKTAKLADNQRLSRQVADWLEEGYSPEQISHRLRLEFPDDPEMRVSHETIYQSLYVQGRGGLRRELHQQLRSGRALRRPRRSLGQRGNPIAGMVNISERPAEVEDRAVPGHWEGDLITGAANGSAIGTLVERMTRFVILLHLPTNHSALSVQEAMIAKMSQLPAILRRTLTWDQGREMTNHAQIAAATDLDIYFCDPHSPWQRGTNENTNGLLRQYFPKGHDLSIFTADYLDFIATRLNNRPRKTLAWKKPAEALDELLSNPTNPVLQ
ncbi:IS30 family transposase [Nocardia brasiliensis]|uniref:IS30 family transposase n=2 Tax=Nocardia brasiliensis TaxID=37326 RepID=UPI000E0582F8|nr:Transposase and inactivated derivatives, IS30 family [Nocardia brasiliensis]SUB53750.1 Transposase and inactivated derivatives, IS30 family [Nocardia brasiliensis]